MSRTAAAELLQHVLELRPLRRIALELQRAPEASLRIGAAVELVEVDGAERLPHVAAIGLQPQQRLVALRRLGGAAEVEGGTRGVLERHRVGGVAASGLAEVARRVLEPSRLGERGAALLVD